MSRLGLLLQEEPPEVTFRRYHLYVVTFGALGVAFQLTALSADLTERSPSASFFFLGLVAMLTGGLALVTKNRAMTSLKAVTAEAIDEDEIVKWRAARRAPPTGVDIHTMLPSFDEGHHANSALPQARQEPKPAKKLDPWAKMLQDASPKTWGQR